MTTHQRKHASILLTLKVLHFISQLRRRVKPRVQRGSFDTYELGTNVSASQTAIRAISRGLPRLAAHDAKQAQQGGSRIWKRRKNNRRVFRPSVFPRTPRTDAPVGPNGPCEDVQQMLVSADVRLSTPGRILSEVAGSNELFLKHDNSPTFDGCSLNEIVRLLVAAQEAVTTLSDCRLQYGDDWLVAQGQYYGLNLDENFIANYEHLLLRLQAELVEALARKALEQMLHGGHNKKQQKLLSWFTEFAEKPRPLGSSFPWTIKPSLAVLWGVCWMFYDAASQQQPNADGDRGRVRGDRMLHHVNVPWAAPGSSEYMNFGLELIGTQPPPAVSVAPEPKTDGNAAVGLNGNVLEARNADTWASDLQPAAADSRLPDPAVGYARAIGQFADAAPPQFPGQSTYYQPFHDHISVYPDQDYLAQFAGNTSLTAFPQLSHTDNVHQSWHLPRSSLPQHSPRHLVNAQQTPTIRVTGAADSHDFAPPHPEDSWSNILYLDPLATSGSPHSNNSPFSFNLAQPSPTMGETLPPPSQIMTIQVPPMKIKHERSSSINSNSNIPTPVSMAGQRSPSPSAQPRHIMSSPQSPHSCSRRVSEDASSQEGDDHLGSLRKNHSYKRSGEPPRNHDAKMVCEHRECSGLTFDRKCEWSKHMDKHDRPYKCLVPGCEKLQGFTYSGGLLRHEREVHKMHGGTKKSLFCPFNDCKRSSGAGFTRKENLAEHIRRVHRRTSMSADLHGLIVRRESIMERSPTAESRQASESPYVRTMEYRESSEPAHKRKFSIFSDRGSERGEDDLRAEIKRLRYENEEKDSRLRQLEQAVMALQQSRM